MDYFLTGCSDFLALSMVQSMNELQRGWVVDFFNLSIFGQAKLFSFFQSLR